MHVRKRIIVHYSLILLCFTSIQLAWPCIASCDKAGNSDDIVLGMSTALTGPASELGNNVLRGVMAEFKRINRMGGIGGRHLRLKVLDDGYEPFQTSTNMLQLIKEEKVLAIIGNVGTPTAIAAIPIANQHKTLFFGAYTGAGVLRKMPPDRYVINYRASYAEEVGSMVDALVHHGQLKLSEIAFFTQRDGYGDAGFSGGLTAMRWHGLKDVHTITHTRYERNTLAVENAVADLMFAPVRPRAIIMVGAYAPCAKFIRLCRQYKIDALFLSVSFVGSAPLALLLADSPAKVVITQVVPHFESNAELVQAYRQDSEAYAPKEPLSFAALEGYVSARIMVHALEGVQGPINRESIVDALEAMGDFDIGLKQELHLDKVNHQASHRIWPTLLHRGEIASIDWSRIKPMLPYRKASQ